MFPVQKEMKSFLFTYDIFFFVLFNVLFFNKGIVMMPNLVTTRQEMDKTVES